MAGLGPFNEVLACCLHNKCNSQKKSRTLNRKGQLSRFLLKVSLRLDANEPGYFDKAESVHLIKAIHRENTASIEQCSFADARLWKSAAEPFSLSFPKLSINTPKSRTQTQSY